MSALVFALFFVGVAGSFSVPAQAAPLQGMYDGCNIGSSGCLAHLDKMGSGGFRVVLDYGSGSSGNSPEQMRKYLDRAQENGIRVIWDFNELAGRSDAPDTVSAVVDAVKGHPATWGYCIGDEASSGKAGSIKEMYNAIKSSDHSHPVFVMGSYNVQSLTSFVGSADFIGVYLYPIGESTDSRQMVSQVGNLAADLKQFAASHGKRSIMALQAFNWADQSGAPDWSAKRWPTRDEMREMRNEALAANPDIILWFSYWHAASGSHWNDLVWAANGR